MKLLKTILIIVFVVLAIGCRSLGETHLSTGQVSVTIGNDILNDPKKNRALRIHHGVELLHEYVLYRVKKARLRESITLELTIHRFRLGWGRDHMGVETVVKEDGKELERFTETITTGRSNAVKRLAKQLAKVIVNRMRDL